MRQLNLKTREGRQAFYQSREWRNTREYKLNMNPVCEECFKTGKLVPATEVHHLIDIEELPTMENALNIDGLESLCKHCHSTITIKKPKKIWKPFNIKEFKEKNNLN